jgi:5-methylcytosine-specific restriction endonuclease McrA
MTGEFTPSEKSVWPSVGKSRLYANVSDENKKRILQKKAETKKSVCEIVDELIEKYLDQIEPRKNQYVGKGWPKEVIDKLEHKCQKCGATAKEAQLHIDHIAPASLFPELCKSPDNIQILCQTCNSSKGNRYIRDYR